MGSWPGTPGLPWFLPSVPYWPCLFTGQHTAWHLASPRASEREYASKTDAMVYFNLTTEKTMHHVFFFFFFTVLFVISKSNHPYRRELHDIGRQESPTGDLLAASCHIHDHRWLLASQKEPTRHHEPPGRNARPPDEVGLPKNQNSHPNLVKYLELTSS